MSDTWKVVRIVTQMDVSLSQIFDANLGPGWRRKAKLQGRDIRLLRRFFWRHHGLMIPEKKLKHENWKDVIATRLRQHFLSRASSVDIGFSTFIASCVRDVSRGRILAGEAFLLPIEDQRLLGYHLKVVHGILVPNDIFDTTNWLTDLKLHIDTVYVD